MPVFEWEKATVNYFQAFRSDPFLETVMQGFSNLKLAIVLGLGIFFFIGRKWDWKTRGIFAFWVLLCLVLSDSISHRIVKTMFLRPRPYSLLTGCSSLRCLGFVSSHSANIASIGTFFSILRPKTILIFFPLYLIVSLSRIFLYKHFPLDVIGGGLLGIFIGGAVYLLELRSPIFLSLRKNFDGKKKI